MIIIKTTSKSYIFPPDSHATLKPIEIDEMCAICGKDIPNNSDVLKSLKTNNIICIDCSTEIYQFIRNTE
jgi:transcription antitermination factor NusA-like protein